MRVWCIPLLKQWIIETLRDIFEAIRLPFWHKYDKRYNEQCSCGIVNPENKKPKNVKSSRYISKVMNQWTYFSEVILRDALSQNSGKDLSS